MDKLNRRAVLASLIVGAVLASCMIVYVNRDNRDAVRPSTPTSTKKYQLLEFGGSWCITCKLQARRLAETASTRILNANNVTLVKIDVDKEKKTAADWGVTEVPVLILVEIEKRGQGKTLRRADGSLSSGDLKTFIDPTKEWTEK